MSKTIRDDHGQSSLKTGNDCHVRRVPLRAPLWSTRGARRFGYLLVAIAVLLGSSCAGSGATNSESATDAGDADNETDDGTESESESDAEDESEPAATAVEPTPTPTPEPTPEVEKPVTKEWEYDGIMRSYYRASENRGLVVFVAQVDGERHDVAVELESGEELWRYPSSRGGVYLGYGPVSPPIVGDTYVTLVDDAASSNRVRVQALDLETGAELWTTEAMYITNYPVACSETAFCVTDRTNLDDPVVRRLDSTTGEEVESPEPGDESVPAADDDDDTAADDDDAAADDDDAAAAADDDDAAAADDDDAAAADDDRSADDPDGAAEDGEAGKDADAQDTSEGGSVEAAESQDFVSIDQHPTDRWVRTRPDGTEVWAVAGADVHGPKSNSAYGFVSKPDREAGVVVVSLGTDSESLEDLVMAGLDYDTGEVLWESQGRRYWGRSAAIWPVNSGPINVRVKTSGTVKYGKSADGNTLIDELIDNRETLEIFDIETGETQAEAEVVPYTDWIRASGASFEEPRSALMDDHLVVLSPDGPMLVVPEDEVFEPVDPENIGWCRPVFDQEIRDEVGSVNVGFSPCEVGDLETIDNPDRLPTTIVSPIGQIVGDYALIVSDAKLRAYRYDDGEKDE